MPTATAPATSQGGQASGGAQPQVLAPFRSGTQRTLSSDGYTNSTALTTTATELPEYTPSANYLLRGLWIQSVATGVNSSNNVAFNGDGPWNAYSTITFYDTGGNPVIGPFDGYTLMIINKFGGYQTGSDPRASAIYSVTTGTGSTGGSWTFTLYVPIEVVSRTGVGSLLNTSSDSTYTLDLWLNTTANVFSTAPATSCTVQTKIYEDGWWKGNVAGASPTPKAVGSTQYWTRGTYNALNGSEQFQVSQGLGQPIRNYVLLNYDVSNSTRATGDTDFPDPFQYVYKGTNMLNISKTMWKDQMSKFWGLSSTTADTANGLENGVFVLPFNWDFGERPGNELGNGYLNSKQGDLNQFIGSWNGNSKLYVLVNYFASVTGSVSALQSTGS